MTFYFLTLLLFFQSLTFTGICFSGPHNPKPKPILKKVSAYEVKLVPIVPAVYALDIKRKKRQVVIVPAEIVEKLQTLTEPRDDIKSE